MATAENTVNVIFDALDADLMKAEQHVRKQRTRNGEAHEGPVCVSLGGIRHYLRLRRVRAIAAIQADFEEG